nr:DUF6244 family protein [Micromonospora sp. KC207]
MAAALASPDGAVAAAAAGIEQARRLIAAALHGGQPGPTLARLRRVAQGLAAVRARGSEARRLVEAALAQALQAGELGKWPRAADRPIRTTPPRAQPGPRTRRRPHAQ